MANLFSAQEGSFSPPPSLASVLKREKVNSPRIHLRKAIGTRVRKQPDPVQTGEHTQDLHYRVSTANVVLNDRETISSRRVRLFARFSLSLGVYSSYIHIDVFGYLAAAARDGAVEDDKGHPIIEERWRPWSWTEANISHRHY